MAAVVVAGQQPLYELGAADLVVRQLDELSLVNLKQLFRNEAHVEGGGVRGLGACGCVLHRQLRRVAGCCPLQCLPSAHMPGLAQEAWAGRSWWQSGGLPRTGRAGDADGDGGGGRVQAHGPGRPVVAAAGRARRPPKAPARRRRCIMCSICVWRSRRGRCPADSQMRRLAVANRTSALNPRVNHVCGGACVQ